MRLRRWAPLSWMSLTYSVCFSFSGPNRPSARSSDAPRTALRGVRSSWDRLARNSLLLRLAASAVSGSNVLLKQASYADLPDVLQDLGISTVDRILLDVGLSSDQLADHSRGFSFDADGPLDLRFDPTQSEPAWKLLAQIGNLWAKPDCRGLQVVHEQLFQLARKAVQIAPESRKRTHRRAWPGKSQRTCALVEGAENVRRREGNSRIEQQKGEPGEPLHGFDLLTNTADHGWARVQEIGHIGTEPQSQLAQ
ncbi:MAG: 16S rRNA (cytosine(1402)-N(4))-methyltransferase [Gemmatimonadetes bacterium]|nr:16S rRNA (cytosine(1402)-N(4))-methyltransferase [Gemmatimonadota bacterium]